jgi:hypothetical protein
MEVFWDAEEHRLHGAEPRRWDHFRWYRQVIEAARMQGVILRPHSQTNWADIPKSLKKKIVQLSNGDQQVDPPDAII